MFYSSASSVEPADGIQLNRIVIQPRLIRGQLRSCLSPGLELCRIRMGSDPEHVLHLHTDVNHFQRQTGGSEFRQFHAARADQIPSV